MYRSESQQTKIELSGKVCVIGSFTSRRVQGQPSRVDREAYRPSTQNPGDQDYALIKGVLELCFPRVEDTAFEQVIERNDGAALPIDYSPLSR
jgi:hypothetical protein